MLKVYEAAEVGRVDPDTDMTYVHGRLFLVQVSENEVWGLIHDLTSRLVELQASGQYGNLLTAAVGRHDFLADLVGAKHWEDL